jgi:hypothetical protein
MTASREMKRDLDTARIDDGSEVTARLRAMIALWQQDARLRARVDELARELRLDQVCFGVGRHGKRVSPGPVLP